MHSADGIVFGPTVVTERRPVAAEVGTIHVLEQDGRAAAYWQGAGNEDPTFLCAMAADAYNSKPALRQRFMELAAMLATGGRDVVVSKVEPVATEPWWTSLPCAQCASPQAADVLHQARQVEELSQLALSPSGHPMACCKVRTLAVMSDPNARLTAR
jgi:hypothetical protein